jgi:ABC-2 type transport system ATP-binding protein
MIRVQQLKKSFAENHAVQCISFEVRAGEFFSLLGPNGAGKTTTISILSTLLHPDAGEVLIDNMLVGSQDLRIRKILGVVPQEIALYDDLSAFENLLFFGSLYNISASELRVRIHTLLQDFGLTDRAHDKIRTFSGGMKRRINIASALLHQPRIVFMDEPTVGIDPQSRNNIFEAIQRLRENGTTIVYTTHYMEEAARFSDRIAIMDKGSIIASGTLAELRAHSGQHESLVITLSGQPDQLSNTLSLPHGLNLQIIDNQLIIRGEHLQQQLPAVMSALLEMRLEIRHMDIRSVDLETIFLSLTGKNLRD